MNGFYLTISLAMAAFGASAATAPIRAEEERINNAAESIEAASSATASDPLSALSAVSTASSATAPCTAATDASEPSIRNAEYSSATALSRSGSGDDKDSEGIKICTPTDVLTWNAPDEFPDHGEPNFVFASRNRRFYLGIGGSVKGSASFDWGDPTGNDFAFITSEIPVDRRPGDGAKWMFSAKTSFVYLNFIAFADTPDRIGAYINFNFTGDGYCPALQYAYLRWRDFTVGYSYTLFTDQQAAAPTLDYQGPNSFTGVQMALVNYEHSFGKGGRWRVGAGLNMPMTSVTDGNGAASVSQRLPDIPAYIQYGSADGSAHIRFTGILRNLYYRDEVRDRNIDKIGWGIKLSGMTPLVGGLSCFGQAVYGRGITSYYQDLTDCGLDMAYSATPGRLTPLKSWGGYLGLQYDCTERLHLSGAYSHIRLYPDGGTLPDGDSTYRYAQYAVGTLSYDITDYLSAGVEYIYGRRVQPDGTQRHDSRLMTALSVNF